MNRNQFCLAALLVIQLSRTVFGAELSFHELHAARARVRNSFRQTVDSFGIRRSYRPGVLLLKHKNASSPVAMLVPEGSESAACSALLRNGDVAYAELDVVLTRQYLPNDPGLNRQWHHRKIGSPTAWSVSFGGPEVTIAIVDTPFQMNHPDLAAHTVPGFDMVRGITIASDPVGFFHSTLGAGMAAAVIDNSIGVSGAANCRLMPIDIGDNPTASDMHDAIVWAADHGVRVVNVSWDGAFSSVINDAGAYLKEKTGGMLFMAGVNGSDRLDYPDQPNIYAVSMTDTNDLARSTYGHHVDFAAPGFDIYSTTINSGYAVDSGTSFSAPLLAGIAAWVMSVNPELGPGEIENILIASCVDLGSPGRDEHYGWGRIDFAEVARRTFATVPTSRVGFSQSPFFTVTVEILRGTYLGDYKLFRSDSLLPGKWEQVQSPIVATNDALLYMTDPAPPGPEQFYKIELDRSP